LSEWSEQRDAIIWFKERWPQHDKCIRLSLNGINLGGGKRAAMMINQMKAQGMVIGESDLCLAISRGYYGCLMIEHKSTEDKSAPKKEQLEYAEYHNSNGNLAVFTKGLEELKQAITEYMEL